LLVNGKINVDCVTEKWGGRFARENAEATDRLKLPVAPESGHNST